jgi:phage-related protein
LGRATETSSAFPRRFSRRWVFALYLAQTGEKAGSAKPLKGFGGAGVLEIVEDHHGDTYRAVYTVRFETSVYVLHAFQKKSKTGIKIPKGDMDLIQRRLKAAQEDYESRTRGER